MKIVYYEEDDTLFIEFSKGSILRDESISWNVNIGFTADGLGEVTVLDAQKSGIYPRQIERVVEDITDGAFRFYGGHSHESHRDRGNS